MLLTLTPITNCMMDSTLFTQTANTNNKYDDIGAYYEGSPNINLQHHNTNDYNSIESFTFHVAEMIKYFLHFSPPENIYVLLLYIN